MRTLFVGDKPSKKNLDPKIPFLGTKSYDTLVTWIRYMRLGMVQFVNSTDDNFEDMVYEYITEGEPIILLGNNAEDSVMKLLDRNDTHFYFVSNLYKMPHPSGRNRKLNDPEYVKKTLNDCRDFIYKIWRYND